MSLSVGVADGDRDGGEGVGLRDFVGGVGVTPGVGVLRGEGVGVCTEDAVDEGVEMREVVALRLPDTDPLRWRLRVGVALPLTDICCVLLGVGGAEGLRVPVGLCVGVTCRDRDGVGVGVPLSLGVLALQVRISETVGVRVRVGL